MKDLEKCIEYLNHFTTISHKDSCILKYKNSAKENPEFDQSISLGGFLYSFGKMYKYYKEDFDKLPKFDFGKSYEIWDYFSSDFEEEATIYITNPKIVNNDYCYLNIVRNNMNNINCYISTDDHEYYSRNVEFIMDKDLANEYMDFIEKYFHFIQCYSVSKGNSMFSNKECTIVSDYYGDIYSSINNIVLKISMIYRDNEYKANIIFNLDKLAIDYDNSKIEGIEEEKRKAIDTILRNLYISKDRIVSLYYDDEEVKTLRLKKGLDI